MKRWRPYPKYKPSGIEWLGEVPTHWKVERLKFAFRFISGGTPPTGHFQYWNGSLPWVSPKDMNSLNLEDTQDHITEEAVRKSATNTVPEGAALMVVRSGILRHSIPATVAQRRMAINQDIKGLIPKNGQLTSAYFVRFIEGHQAQLLTEWRKEGTTVESLEYDLIANFGMLNPPQEEQRTIAAFLDRETARIDDTLIEKKERQIELLREKRTALISHAVTKGLDPNVKMKDSGIEWLGDVPEHWEVQSLKYSATIIMGQSPKSDNYSYNNNELPFLQGNAEFGIQHPAPRLFCDKAKKVAPINSILLSVRAPVGALNIADQVYGIGRGLCAILPNKKILLLSFTWYLFGVVREELTSISTGSTYDAVSVEKVSSTMIIQPPINEQRAIAAFLDRETARIDTLIEKIRKSIDLLCEYRTALISAAVTGKIDVREIK